MRIHTPHFHGNPFRPPSPSDLLPPGVPTPHPSPQLPTPTNPLPFPDVLPSPGHIPFHPVNGNTGPKPEDRLADFKFADGSPMWKTETQKAALLKILQQDPTMTVEAFKRSQDMSLICTATYPRPDGTQNKEPTGYMRVDAAAVGLDPRQLVDSGTGFHAEVYRNNSTGNYVLSFRGTDSKGDALIKDIKNGDLQAFDPRAPQFKQAIELARSLKEKLGDKLTDITGQSLGGALAAAASVFTGIRATTFNSAGLNPATVAYHGGNWDEGKMKGLITNFRVAGDPLTEAQEGNKLSTLADALAQRLGHGWLPHLPTPTEIPGPNHLPQVSYISGALAEKLPDAVGSQITLDAIDQNGNSISNSDQLKPGNWAYLHDFAAINAGILGNVPRPGLSSQQKEVMIAYAV